MAEVSRRNKQHGMDMWMEKQWLQGMGGATLLCDFGTAKPEFRREERKTIQSVPCPMHVIDGPSKLINWAISDCQCQKDCVMSREVFVELGKTFEEAFSPSPTTSPFAEWA
jgi:hypothetical protein